MLGGLEPTFFFGAKTREMKGIERGSERRGFLFLAVGEYFRRPEIKFVAEHLVKRTLRTRFTGEEFEYLEIH